MASKGCCLIYFDVQGFDVGRIRIRGHHEQNLQVHVDIFGILLTIMHREVHKLAYDEVGSVIHNLLLLSAKGHRIPIITGIIEYLDYLEEKLMKKEYEKFINLS